MTLDKTINETCPYYELKDFKNKETYRIECYDMCEGIPCQAQYQKTIQNE